MTNLRLQNYVKAGDLFTVQSRDCGALAFTVRAVTPDLVYATRAGKGYQFSYELLELLGAEFSPTELPILPEQLGAVVQDTEGRRWVRFRLPGSGNYEWVLEGDRTEAVFSEQLAATTTEVPGSLMYLVQIPIEGSGYRLVGAYPTERDAYDAIENHIKNYSPGTQYVISELHVKKSLLI